MIWRLGMLCLLAALALAAPRARAEDDAPGRDGVAWFQTLAAARKVATATGRPVFLAVHVLPRVVTPRTEERTKRWQAAYRDEAAVALSREFACVLRLQTADARLDAAPDAASPSALHMVLNGEGRVLARLDRDLPPSAGVIARLMRVGLRRHGAIPDGAPRIDRRMVAAKEPQVPGASPGNPVGLAVESPGLRMRLRWELPAPVVPAEGPQTFKAEVSMRWDGEGPFPLGVIEFAPGDEVDIPVDIRFDEVKGLRPLATEGLHRVDVYLEPGMGSFPFSKGPVFVGGFWVNLGDGGGGGGSGGNDDQQPEPKEEDQEPQEAPEGKEEEPLALPDKAQDDVIDPFVGDGETVKKDDAVVAVEDDDAGVKPPEQMPLAKALREFEKEREAAIGRDGISARERAFLRRYFELLRQHATPAPKAPPKAPGKKAPK